MGFTKTNEIYPHRVIVIRDGLSVSQMEKYLNTEVRLIRDELSKIESKPKLTNIVLNKRNSSKFFSMRDNNYTNPLPGTLINDTVCRQDVKEFYLVSQKCNIGTATPIHYELFEDENNLKMEDVSTLIYKLCYTYYNWSGSIKVPAPVHYAMKLAYMVGDKLNINDSFVIPNSRLSSMIQGLFYI